MPGKDPIDRSPEPSDRAWRSGATAHPKDEKICSIWTYLNTHGKSILRYHMIKLSTGKCFSHYDSIDDHDVGIIGNLLVVTHHRNFFPSSLSPGFATSAIWWARWCRYLSQQVPRLWTGRWWLLVLLANYINCHWFTGCFSNSVTPSNSKVSSYKNFHGAFIGKLRCVVSPNGIILIILIPTKCPLANMQWRGGTRTCA